MNAIEQIASHISIPVTAKQRERYVVIVWNHPISKSRKKNQGNLTLLWATADWTDSFL